MAIAFRAESHITPGSGTSPTGTEPTGTSNGDVLVALFVVDAPGGTPGIPSGWVSVRSGTSNSTHFRYNLCYVVRGGSAPSLAFTHTGTTYRELYIVGYSGVDNANVLDQTSPAEVKTTSTTVKPDPPSITTVTAGAMVIAAHVMWGGAPTATGWTAPTNHTIRSGNIVTIGPAGALSDRLIAVAGSEDPSTFGGTPQGGDDGWAQTIALRPSSGSSVTVKPLSALGVG